MDRWLIRSGPPVPAKPPPEKKSKIDYDRQYDKKRVRIFQDSWLNEYSWLEVNDEMASCKVCKKYPAIAETKSGLFTGQTVSRKDTLSTHDKSSKHALCILQLEHDDLKKCDKKFEGEMDRVIQKCNVEQLQRYNLLFNTAFAVAKKQKPFTDYEFLCEVQKKNGLSLGSDHLNRKACIQFVKSIAGVLHSDVREKLSQCRFYSVMSDSSTDSSITDQECIMVRFVDPETKAPSTTLASIESLETPDANGIFTAIKDGLKTLDIDLDTNQNGVPALVCANMDGASVNMGSKNGVAKKLSDSVNHPVLTTHCVAHRLELGVLDAAKSLPYLEQFEQTLKRIYKFYSFSPKRRAHLQKISEVLQNDLVMYSDIKSIRWVSSKKRAVHALVTDYEATVMHLEQIQSSSKRGDEKVQAKKLLSDIKLVKFVKYMHLMIDVLHHITAVSELFQTKDLLMFEVDEAINTLYSQIHAMTVSPGASLSEFYKQLDPSTSVYKGIKLNGPHIKEFENDKNVRDFLEKVCDDVLKRFDNLHDAPIKYFKVFDSRLWPQSLNELALYGNEDIASLCNYYSDLLSEEERVAIPDEWKLLKVRISMQKGHPLPLLTQILQSDDKRLSNIKILIELLQTFSPSTAACERAFSSMNLIKTPSRNKLGQTNLVNQMRISITGPTLEEFDPEPSVMHWLKNTTGTRHLTHKPKTAAPQPSTSTASDEPVGTDLHLFNEVMDKIVDDETCTKVKNAMSKEQCLLQ